MISIVFRIALIVGALCVFAFVLYKIRRSEIKVADFTFWFLFEASFVLLAVFPQIAFFCADLFGYRVSGEFRLSLHHRGVSDPQLFQTVELSKLRAKLTALVQEEVLEDAERREGE